MRAASSTSCSSAADRGEANRPMHARVDRDLNADDIGRHFDHDRPLPPVLHLAEGTAHDIGDLLRLNDLLDRFGDRGVGPARFEHREQLRRLARMAERQEHHRARIRKSGRNTGERILGARPVLHREDTRRAAVGNPREPVGHVHADPLLAADDRLDPDRRRGLDYRGRRKAKRVETLSRFKISAMTFMTSIYGSSRVDGTSVTARVLSANPAKRVEAT
jgi:hypothetical protein